MGSGSRSRRPAPRRKTKASATTHADSSHVAVSLPPTLSDPASFPGMSALCVMAHGGVDIGTVVAGSAAAMENEARGRLARMLAAEWTPSTSRCFELLTGRVPGCTYYLYARTTRTPCVDLCGGFAAVLGGERNDDTAPRSADVRLLIPLPKDVAVYAWDLASLITQASYCLTFLVSAGFPPHVIEPFQACVEEIMAFNDVAPGQLPNLESVSERLSAVTFEVAVVAYAVLAQARVRLGRPLALEPVLSEEGQVVVQRMQQPRLAVIDDPAVGNPGPGQEHNHGNVEECYVDEAKADSTRKVDVPALDDALQEMEAAVRVIGEAGVLIDAPTQLGQGAALQQHRPGAARLEWEDLDEASRELMEHFVLCGLSNISHLRMTHTLHALPFTTLYTRLSISQTRVQPDGIMVPPPPSKELQELLEARAPFSSVVRHPHLDNEHIVTPDALHEYLRATPLPDMMEELTAAVLAYTDTTAFKDDVAGEAPAAARAKADE